MVDRGIDPRDDKAEKKGSAELKRQEAQRQETLVGESWAIYLEDRRPHWSKRYHRDHVRLSQPGGEPKRRGTGKTKQGPLAPLLTLKLSEIQPDRIREWLTAEAADRPTQARQAFGAFKTFLLWCEDRSNYRGLAAPEAFANRIARQQLPKKGAKDDVLQREQLSAWFSAVQQLGNPVTCVYLQALLLTGTPA